MHYKATLWLRAGNARALRMYRDVIDVMHERAWLRCTCKLYDRIDAFLKTAVNR